MDHLNIAAPLLAALSTRGYETLTAVQEAVLADGTEGRDMLVSAQTGSGKTVAFGLAIAPEILGGSDRLLYADTPLALVIAPTRELAQQVARELEWLYAAAGAKIATCVGGMDYRAEKRALDRGAHIVVGTPGRLRDHIERKSLDLSGIHAVVLDEADEMLDLGFADDLEFILAAAPDSRRTLMFSATVPQEIAKLAQTFQKDALRIAAQGEQRQHTDIEYRALSVAVRDREHAIFNALRYYEAQTAIVFCKTRANVSHLMARMGNRGFQVVALSGELSQNERMHALQSLRDGRARVCIATDVAARGIDLPGLELVIHADLPTNSETLLHRSGRTGRAGKKGVSALIVAPSEVRKAQRLLQGAKVVAEWAEAPGADEVQARDDLRLLEHPALSAGVGEETVMVAKILEQFPAQDVAAAFVRLWREGRSAPEVLSTALPPAEARAPRERSEFGPSVWFKVSVGHTGRAEARWLLPKICDAGGISKDSIGAIRVQQDETFVQIAQAVAGRFGATNQIDADLTMDKLDGEPSLARPERAPFAERAPRAATPRPAAAPRAPRADKPVYVPKPARIVEDDAEAPARKPYTPREDGPKKPYAPREDKPYAPRAAGERKPYAPREDGPKKPYAPREDGPKKPYAKREDGPAKPYAAKPYAAKSSGDDADRKPRWAAGDKPKSAPKSAGFKSHGGSADRPARAEGFKSHRSEPTGGAPRKPYAPRAEGSDARPFAKKPGGPAKAGGFKSAGAEGKKPFVRSKPPASDTSKRFVPPKKK